MTATPFLKRRQQRHPPKALRPVRKRNKSTRYRPVSRLGLDDCDLSYGLIVGSDVCIDGLTTRRKHCRRSCIIVTCGYDFRKGQVPPYAVMLSYCFRYFRMVTRRGIPHRIARQRSVSRCEPNRGTIRPGPGLNFSVQRGCRRVTDCQSTLDHRGASTLEGPYSSPPPDVELLDDRFDETTLASWAFHPRNAAVSSIPYNSNFGNARLGRLAGQREDGQLAFDRSRQNDASDASPKGMADLTSKANSPWRSYLQFGPMAGAFFTRYDALS